ERRAAEGMCVHAQLAEKLCALGFEFFNRSCIALGKPILQQRRVTGRANSFGEIEVLDRDGNAVKRSADFSCRKFGFRATRVGAGALGSDGDEAVKFFVKRATAFETCL